jgi:hypothetical protein
MSDQIRRASTPLGSYTMAMALSRNRAASSSATILGWSALHRTLAVWHRVFRKTTRIVKYAINGPL